MAVIPGNPILLSDMTALATLANGKSSLINYVSPLGTDGSGNPYGYNVFSGVAIASGGTGYLPGDILSLGFGSEFSVAMVGVNGQVLGIRIVNTGQGSYGDSATSPLAVTGGTGTGCFLSFSSFSQYGPTANYNFGAMGIAGLDFTMSLGNVTAIYLVNGGTGYTAGNTLGIDELPLMVITVNTVDGSGKILTATMTAGTNAITVPQDVAAMSVTGGSGSGAQFGGYFTLAQKPTWLTELNRMRSNIDTFSFILTNETRISGVWPVSGFVNSYTANIADCTFYYADNGSPQSVSISCSQLEYFSDENIADILANNVSATYTTQTFQIVVGGNQTVLLNGELDFYVYASSTPSISVVATLPGCAFTLVGGSTYQYKSTFSNVSCPPGQYQIKIVISGGGIFQSGFPNLAGNASGGNPLSCSFTQTVSQATNGIHNSAQVRKIICPQTPSNGTFPFGIWGKFPNPGPFTNRQYIFLSKSAYATATWETGFVSMTASIYGFFTALTPIVSSLNPATPNLMPWNLLRTKYGSSGSAYVNPMLQSDLAPNIANVAQVSNSYDNTKTVEAQTEPPSWQANTYFQVGFIIMPVNGYVFQCNRDGVSGSTPPSWTVTVQTEVFDGFTGWTCLSTPTKSNYNSAVHRSQSIPRYPVYWQSETIAKLLPPTATGGASLGIFGALNQWNRNTYHSSSYDVGWQQDNQAKGWWIYSVSLNRVGGNFNGSSLLPTQDGSGNAQQVAVTIGCMRSGSFVSFGTWETGQTIQVLWPIFTSDALVYQCSERVDIQAVAIASGGAGVSSGAAAAGYPICAAFVSDVTALLALIT